MNASGTSHRGAAGSRGNDAHVATIRHHAVGCDGGAVSRASLNQRTDRRDRRCRSAADHAIRLATNVSEIPNLKVVRATFSDDPRIPLARALSTQAVMRIR
jgi:hypothetical protein